MIKKRRMERRKSKGEKEINRGVCKEEERRKEKTYNVKMMKRNERKKQRERRQRREGRKQRILQNVK